MKTNPAEFLFDAFQDKLPDSLRPFVEEARTSGKRFIHNRLDDFDLVTREEFEAQQQLLIQALAKIDELEKKLNSH